MFDPDIKERIRQALDLVDVARGYLELRPSGRIYKALCPWHPDSNPSLTINPDRQSYKCWVCNEGGDLFSFMMKIEGVSFPEAIRMLAERAGIEIKASAPRRGEPQEHDHKRTLYQALAWAEEQFHQCLLTASAADPARRYLAERNISPTSISRFKLGFAPDEWDWIIQRAAGTPFSPAILDRVGLVVPRQSGSGFYDRFKGRVLFPIHDLQGRPVGVGGRILPEFKEQSPAKYINSPETVLFSKSNLLFGLDLARNAIQRARTAIVMEGYTDCLMAHQCGVDQAVAVLGTALTERHLHLLRRFCDRVVLVLDGDDAGRRRANDLVQLFVSQQMDLRIVTLPDELDPCEFLLERGADAFRQAVHDAPDALSHKVALATAGLDVRRDLHAASKVLDELVSLVAQAPRLTDTSTTSHHFREQTLLNRLSLEFNIPESELRARMTQLRRQEKRGARMAAEVEPLPVPAVHSPPWEKELVSLILQRPDFLSTVRSHPHATRLSDPQLRRVYDMCVALADAGREPTFARLMLEFDDEMTKRLLVDLDEEGAQKVGLDPAVRLQGLFTRVEQLALEAAADRALWRMRQNEVDEADEAEILKQLIAARTEKPKPAPQS